MRKLDEIVHIINSFDNHFLSCAIIFYHLSNQLPYHFHYNLNYLLFPPFFYHLFLILHQKLTSNNFLIRSLLCYKTFFIFYVFIVQQTPIWAFRLPLNWAFMLICNCENCCRVKMSITLFPCTKLLNTFLLVTISIEFFNLHLGH